MTWGLGAGSLRVDTIDIKVKSKTKLISKKKHEEMGKKLSRGTNNVQPSFGLISTLSLLLLGAMEGVAAVAAGLEGTEVVVGG